MWSRLFFAAARRIPLRPRQMRWIVQHLSLGTVRKLSEARLLRTLRHVYENSPAQREHWQKAGIREDDLRSPDVLPHLPFTTGSDLTGRPDDYVCVPRERLVHLISSSGTKGRAKEIRLTEEDFDHHLRMTGASVLRLPGGTRAAVMFCTRVPGWTVASTLQSAIEKAGMFSIRSGTHVPVREQIRLLHRHRVNVLFTSPTYLHRLTLETPEEPKNFGLRYILLGSQPWTERFRSEMEPAWGARLIDVYGSAEFAFGIASECLHRSGLHVCEVDFHVEIVDPATGKPLPDGEEGEVVVTTLSRRGMPLVRYRLRDLARLIPRGRHCACGLPFRKMSRVRGRLDDVVILGAGHNVYPDSIDAAVLSVPGVTDYQLVIEKDSYRDVLHLTVEHDTHSADLRDSVVKALLGLPELRDGLEGSRTVVLGRLEVVKRGSLAADRPKTRRIVDRRG